MLFEQIIAPGPVAGQLRSMTQTDRLPHALLLAGPTGGGSLALGLALAQYLLCEQRAEADACGQCPACIKNQKWIHPDLHFAFPTVGTNALSDHFLPEWRSALTENPYLSVNDWLHRIGAENKQGNINKEECNNITRKLSLKIFEGRAKVLLMWLPEYLGNEGNRLLKLVEEPPELTHFIFVTENPDLILPTILSRCQLVRIPPLSDAVVAQALETHWELPADRARDVARLADGDINEARKLSQATESDYGPLFLDWMRRCFQGKPTDLVDWTDDFAKLGREDQKQFLRYGLHYWREFLAMKIRGEAVARLLPAEAETAARMQALVGLEQLGDIVALFDDCIRYVERNANPKIIFLDASIRMHHIFQRPKTPAAVT
jgi:DNA polymerase-3 subunit delta'